MELLFKGLHRKICLLCLDDMRVTGRMFEEELELLKQVIEWLAGECWSLSQSRVFSWRRWFHISYMWSHWEPLPQTLYKLTEAKTEFVWTEQFQLAFDSLKGLCTSGGVQAYTTREGKMCKTPTHQTREAVQSYHSFRMGCKSPLCLQVPHCPSLKGTIVWLVENSRQLLNLLSNTGIACKAQDSACELIMPYLCFVIQATHTNGQFACSTEFLSTFNFEKQY